jgi:hypothetical protein
MKSSCQSVKKASTITFFAGMEAGDCIPKLKPHSGLSSEAKM